MAKYLFNEGEIIKNYKILERNKRGKNFEYKCECIYCGNITNVLGINIFHSKGKGCKKCWSNSYIHNEFIGKKYGCLTVIGIGENKKYRNQKTYLCKCDCGNEVAITRETLLYKKHNCCLKCRGEYLKTNNGSYKHGKTGTQIYSVWNNMKRRCYDKKNNRYEDYGAKGITVCDEWLGENGFENFYNWAIKNGYSDKKTSNGINELSIDRIDVNGNYEPKNCRWVNIMVQQNNKRNNKLLEYNGEIHTMAEWSRILNVNYPKLQSRLYRGKSFEEAIIDC